jgi:signal transduction histidine kinase
VNPTAAIDDYATILSHRVAAERLSLATTWLERLQQLLPIGINDVFPTSQLLDHVPVLIGEIATYLRAPADEEIAANTAVLEKARELGALRHAQRASVHQLIREYESLAEILQAFLAEETLRLGLAPSSAESFELFRRLTRATGTLMRTTVDTFVSAYTTTIEEQNERLMSFNRTASHELRSPIGTILFAAGLLDKDRARIVRDDARLTKITTTLRTNAERLRWLVDNLQRMAKLSEPLDVPSQQCVEVEAIAGEIARQLADMAAARGVSIRVRPGLPTIMVDAARLELALLNLVSNGIKYSNPHQADPWVEIARVDEPGSDPGRCTIVVRDNGVGIPEAQQGAVFERFFRAHPHLDQELGVTGSGLGLAIAADCVTAMDGSIRCESSPDVGTAFYLNLPCEKASHT